MKNVAVVGFGYAGRAFHSYLVSLADGLNVYAIMTRNAARQQEAAQAYPEARIVADLDEILQDPAVDLVVLATPHDTHRELAVRAMQAGKHVVTDKVMCMNAHEAEEMIVASRQNGVILSVFQNRRWDWDYLTVRKVIADGLLGEPYLYEAAIMNYGQPRGWRAIKSSSGGILYDWPAHFIDQALQLVPSPVSRVYCQITNLDAWSGDIGNYAKLLLHFQNGVLYQIEIGNLAAAPKPRWYVVGTRGALVRQGIDPQEDAMRRGDILSAEEDPAAWARLYRVVDGVKQSEPLESVRASWTAYYANISAVLNEGAELIVKPEQLLDVMRVYDAAMQSAETGQAVTLG